MNPLLQVVRNLGSVRLAAMAGVAVGLVVFFVYLTTRLAAPNLALLYGELDPADSTQIAAQLDGMNVPYEVRAGGSQVLVPSDQVARIRIAVAEQGLPSGGSVGYEIFDRDEFLGSSSFVQDINRTRALEGELSRTIASIGPVKGARVHLVLPKRELFSRERQNPSASIILRMRGAARLDRGQVQAVQHLVAAAVPGLKPALISIVDDRGTLLARGGDEASQGQFGGMTADELRLSFETRMTRVVEQLLERSVGIGRVRAEVRAELDLDRIVTNEESYDPDGQVVRSTQSIEEVSSSSEGGEQSVSVGGNLPDATGADGDGGNNTASRTEEATNFEISRTVRNQVHEAGDVQRLSVAVLVDGIYTELGDGTREYQPRSPEELEQIGRLVRSAIGYEESRGDTIEVVNMQFAELPVSIGEDGIESVLGFTRNDLLRLAEVLVLAVVGLLVILLVVRPLITRLFEAGPRAMAAAAGGAPGQQMLTDQSGRPVALAPPGMPGAPAISTDIQEAQAAAMAAQQEAEALDSMIDIGRVEGRVKASSLRKVGEIIEKHPEEAVSIIRNWMYQEP